MDVATRKLPVTSLAHLSKAARAESRLQWAEQRTSSGKIESWAEKDREEVAAGGTQACPRSVLEFSMHGTTAHSLSRPEVAGERKGESQLPGPASAESWFLGICINYP